VGQNERSAGVGWNGSKTGWGHVGMDIKSAGTGGIGCNFCARLDLYSASCSVVQLC